ncbi:MAG: hypothetical protein IIU39_00955, partial [Ruminococcus sp.]|nr:hypothetical protein [Ruminococcus sp.]
MYLVFNKIIIPIKNNNAAVIIVTMSETKALLSADSFLHNKRYNACPPSREDAGKRLNAPMYRFTSAKSRFTHEHTTNKSTFTAGPASVHKISFPKLSEYLEFWTIVMLNADISNPL